MFNILFEIFKLYFLHFFTLGIILFFVYAFWYDFFRVKQICEIPSDEDLMVRYIEARRRGLIK